MQVATLFRETATLLGAAMEAQEAAPGSEQHNLKLFPDNRMKQEPHDDGYETSGDLEMRSQGDGHKLYNPMLKLEANNDPYSFVDDEAAVAPPVHQQQQRAPSTLMQAMPKKRGRKKKIKPGDEGLENTENLLNGDPLMKKKKLKEDKPHFKERKKHDRFNGMPEEEVSKRTLPDHLAQNLDVVIIGINPGLFAAYKGHHYAGPGNHFWKCLYLSGLTPEPMTADDDYKLLQYGVGFTNMVSRATKGSADLTRKEIKEGSQILLEKLQKFKPKIAVFNGKLIYEVFSGKKDFSFGRQPDFVEGTNTYMWVMPSSSARCAQLPRAADKVPFYAALKKFRDYLNGIISDLDETEVVFTDSKLKNYTEPDLKLEGKDERSFYGYGRLPNNGELTDLSNAIVRKEGDASPPKKKRGRPKKVKCEGMDHESQKEGTPELAPSKEHKNGETLKKKRGRPKKVKMDHDGSMIPNGLPDHTNSSIPLSSCFSPPIQSPNNFCQQNFSPSYNTQVFNSHSPSSAHNYHQSPGQSHRYSQSPQPPSQPFTHSDLSSEISAAISSEHNLGSPSPTSPSLGPPDFEPPATMPEDTSDNPSAAPKDETSADANQNECRFSSPTPPTDNPTAMNYPSYGNFSADSETNSAVGYSQGSTPEYKRPNMTQDVASKSLSGLESLVDQIPSIAEGENAVNTANPSDHYDSSHAPSSHFTEQESAAAAAAAYLASSYPSYTATSSAPVNYSPHYSTPSTNYTVSTSNTYSSLHQSSASMNFSVSSLANSSASDGQVSSSFSVTSLASNYSPINPSINSYPNLMGSPHMMANPNSGMFGGAGPMASIGGGIMERACTMGGLPTPMTGMNMPYPYSQYSASPSTYSGAAGGGFPYSPAHGLHMPSPNYPYPSPYSNSPYPQAAAGYLQNHVLDRIKQDRMDIGFGGF